jgi:hypothetical protein
VVVFHEKRDRYLVELGASLVFVAAEKVTHVRDTTLGGR